MSKNDTPTSILPPFSQIVRTLPQDFVDTILTDTQTNSREMFVALISAIGATLKFRPNIWRTWPRTKQREWLWSNLLQPRFAETARQILQDWYFSTRAAMLNAFLDTLGIAHDPEGYVHDKLPETLDADKVCLAVDGLLATYPAREVALYLQLFQYSHPAGLGWEPIATLLSTDPRFIEK